MEDFKTAGKVENQANRFEHHQTRFGEAYERVQQTHERVAALRMELAEAEGEFDAAVAMMQQELVEIDRAVKNEQPTSADKPDPDNLPDIEMI